MDERMNTMEDLRYEVASRLRNALHGRKIDTIEKDVELPHMLGITPIGKQHDPLNEEMTIIDPRHPFWTDYEKKVDTENKAIDEIKDAIHLLREEGVFRKTHPYGKEADIVYVEVDRLDEDSSTMETKCLECGETVQAKLGVVPASSKYELSVEVECSCGFSNSYRRPLVRN